MIRVLIADDQALLRESLKIVLSVHEDIDIVGTAGDGFEVLEFLQREQVDIILMDIRMPNMDGVYCTKMVKEKYPNIKIIILTTFDDDDFVFGALKHGASGYLLKDVGMDELYKDITIVHNGGALINPDIASKVVTMFSQLKVLEDSIIKVDERGIQELNKPEWKVIGQVGRGLSNKEIARVLFLSEGTIRNYLSSILSKLNLRDRTQLAIWAVQTGQVMRRGDNE